jgi:tRNA 2-thiouridine synthesizing protein A
MAERELPVMADLTLDTSGLNCPLPILKTKKALSSVPVGGTLEVLATDPGAEADFVAFCQATGNVLVESGSAGSTTRFLIRRTS